MPKRKVTEYYEHQHVYSVRNNAAKLEKPFLNWKDQSITTDFKQAPEVIFVNGLNQATGQGNRVGRVVNLQSIQFRAYASLFPGGLNERMLLTWKAALVLDRSPNGVKAAYSDIYDDAGGGFLTFDFLNIDNSKRFQVLKTWNNIETSSNWLINPLYFAPGFNRSGPYEWYYKFPGNGLKSLYSDVLADINAISTNALLFLVGCSEDTTGMSPVHRLDGQFRLRYTS